MDAVELIKADHQRVEALFREYEQAGDHAYKTKQRLATQISEELTVHATLEEEGLYPELKAKLRKDEEDGVNEAYEEHHVVKLLLGELDGMEPEAPEYDAKMNVLMENVRHHVEEEESELLPEAEQVLGGQRLDQLGEWMQQRRQQLRGGDGG